MLMHPSDRRIDRDDPIQPPDLVATRLHPRQNSLPGAVLGPPIEPLEHRIPRTEPLRQITPRRARAKPPHDPLDNHPVIQPRTASTLHPRQQRLNHSPRLIRDHITLMHEPIVAEHTRNHLINTP